jgi:hypothetical protein
MKIIRWILSHLTLFIIIFLLLYFFFPWNNILNSPQKTLMPADENQKNIASEKKIETKSTKTSENYVKIVEKADILKQQELTRNKEVVSSEKVIKQLSESAEKARQNSVAALEQSLENVPVYTDKEVLSELSSRELQEQIKARQKQLSQHMVSLISVELPDLEDGYPDAFENINIKSVQPVIETAQQGKLLEKARQAFDEGHFDTAEENYILLMEQLPELPDVVGELANVYRVQKRYSEYVEMNTRFVERLIAHFRFEEAWRVALETEKVDKQSATTQKEKIYNKHKELQQESD